MAVQPTATPTTATPSAARRTRRVALQALAGLFLFFLAALLWLLATQSGLRAALGLAAWASGGRLTVSAPAGRLIGPLSIGTLGLENAHLRIAVERLELDWQPRELFNGRLQVDRLAMAALRIATAPGEPHPASPASPPQTLRLPLAVVLRALQVELLAVEPWTAADDGRALFALRQLRAAAHSDGRLHRIDHLELALPESKVAVKRLTLAADPPFALGGEGGLAGAIQGRAFTARFTLAGNLIAPLLRLDAEGQRLGGHAEALAAPFEAVPLRRLQLALGELDPAAFVDGAPRAALRLSAELRGESSADAAGAWTLRGPLKIDNAQPGRIDQGRLPFTRIAATLAWQARGVRIDDLTVALPGEGRLSGSLGWQADEVPGAEAAAARLPGRMQAALLLSAIDPALLNESWPALRLSGRIEAESAGALQTARAALEADGARLDVDLRLDGAEPSASAFALQAALRGLRWRQFSTDAPEGVLGLDLSAQGRWSAAPEAALSLRLTDSRLAGSAVTGGGRLALAGERVHDLDLGFEVGGNRILVGGAWGRVGDHLRLALDAPRLAALGFGLGGRAGATVELSGSLAEPAGAFMLFADALSLPGGIRLAGINGEGRLEAGGEGAFRLALGLSGLSAASADSGPWVDTGRLVVEGSRAAHRIELSAQAGMDQIEAVLQGGVAPGARIWRGMLAQLATRGRFPARLIEAVALEAGPTRVALAPARIDAGAQGRILLAHTEWTPRLAVFRGTLSGLAFGLHARADGRPQRGPGPLVLGAEWDVRLADTAEGELRVFREAGDLQVSGEIRTRLGLEHLEARLSAHNNRLALALDAQGSELGTLTASLTALAERTPEGGWRLAPDGALLGAAHLAMPSIAWLGRLLQENLETAGRLSADLTVSGTPASALARGQISGSDITLALIDQGLYLSGGELSAEFDRDRLRLARLDFVSPNRVRPRETRLPVDALTATPGTLGVQGEIALDSGVGRFDFRAERLPLLQRPDRWLILSGAGQARSTWRTLALEADLRADAGYLELADTPPPSLSDDVVVLGRAAPADGALGVDADIRVSLGEQLYLSALGLDTRLTGELRLRRSAGRPVSATGTIATAGGSYRGYGQQLSIERGLINFQGALDNPGLNLVALRKGLAVEAGVMIGGSARRPQVRLVSDPPVPDPEKLSWMVLGRAPDAGAGADLGLLLPAAQALLGGPGGGMTEQLSRSLGLEEFSIGQGEVGGVSRRATSRVVGSGTAVEGGGTLGGQVLTVGKRLSGDLYLSFEQSLGGAERLVKLTYQLSRRLSLVARGGTDNAIDAYYTFSFR